MNAFVNAVANQEARTSNNMKAHKSSSNALVDLFYNIGASRGKNIVPAFTAAYVENRDLALRIALWARDVRGGAGERQLFRDILVHLEKTDPTSAVLLVQKIADLGRFDDLFVFKTPALQNVADAIWHDAIFVKQNGLAAKWTPRKGPVAARLCNKYKLNPKQYRKILVNLTKVVETQMCANDWDNINFSQVPSQASRIYRNAFKRHTTKFAEYVEKLNSGDKSVKVNASAVFPHEVLKGMISSYGIRALHEKTDLDHITAQWNALPNYVGNNKILPIVDVSGSMNCPAGRNTTVTCMDISVSLGLYLADKNTGPFNGTFLTFSERPELKTLHGNIMQKLDQIVKSDWGMSTNINSAFDTILDVAVKNDVPSSDMPKIILILSDMQFDQCIHHDDSAMEMIERKYNQAGYEVPIVVFWNLNGYNNVPVKSNKEGAALVSGFSPAIMKSILEANPSAFTPEGVMLQTILNERYAI